MKGPFAWILHNFNSVDRQEDNLFKEFSLVFLWNFSLLSCFTH